MSLCDQSAVQAAHRADNRGNMSSKKTDLQAVRAAGEGAGKGHAGRRLEVVDYNPAQRSKAKSPGRRRLQSLRACTGKPSDTARIAPAAVDLRKLSEWIKTTQQVKRCGGRLEDWKTARATASRQSSHTGRDLAVRQRRAHSRGKSQQRQPQQQNGRVHPPQPEHRRRIAALQHRPAAWSAGPRTPRTAALPSGTRA